MKKTLLIIVIIIGVIIGGYKIYEINDSKQTKESTKAEIPTIDKENETRDMDNPNDDMELYFIEPIKITDSNTIINTLSQNNWSKECLDSLLGDYDNIISRPTDLCAGGTVMFYRTYNNEGLKVQFTSNENYNHIYSLIFNDEYKDKIIGDIDMNSSFEDIISMYDAPHFINEEVGLIGYKCEDFYMFFIGKDKLQEISFYSRIDYDETSIEKAIMAYEKTGMTDEFTNMIWDDYDYTAGESGLIFYDYDSRGVVASLDVADNNMKVTIYGNFIGNITDEISLPTDAHKITKMKDELKNRGIEILLEEDLVYNCELERLKEYDELKGELVDEYGEKSPDGNMLLLNAFSMYTGNRIKIYDETQENLFVELWGVDNYGWINDRYLIYTQAMDEMLFGEGNNKYGIFIYDCLEKKEISVVSFEEREAIFLTSWDKNTIGYNIEEENSSKEYTLEYTFDEEGNISIGKVKQYKK
ncbi:hypothetical protein SH1V18_31840 [Vallitalea longa]|uniref:Uncharacterized protein n=1 Tax=Vallitalea longa TaxID=2936439 RepID=A0A9W5YCT1_9FIRM|nr:hypothetical protein [Vallitalea longa]GKX30704.1 hypothetical protein SH1V18_31840 [Vallitalea longa]